ncbi:MAG: hypothetical protein ACUVYA_07905 [Planctomycetota bacterium]
MFDTLDTEELEFVKAIERFKAKTGKAFPSWTEVLRVLKDLGYKKVNPKAPAREKTPDETALERAEAPPS